MRSRFPFLIAAAGALSACGEDIEEPHEIEGGAIVNGLAATTNPNNAAVYHMAVNNRSCGSPYPRPYNGWWTRPCSGTVIKRTATETYVLTARHCVTEDGTLDGPLLGGTSNLRVSTEIAPGPVPVIWSPPAVPYPDLGRYIVLAPPASAVAGSVFAAADPADTFDVSADLAIVRVGARLPLPDTLRFGVYRGSAGDLNGRVVVSWGYGRNTAGDCDYDISSGAGTLRMGFWFTIAGSTPFSYSFTNLSDPRREKIAHGDSGGGSFLTHPILGYRILTGVHSWLAEPAAFDAGGANLADWIQAQMGALYLASLTEYSSERVVGTFLPASGARLNYRWSGDTFRTRITYLPASGQIRLGATGAGGVFCFKDNSPEPDVVLAVCSSAGNQSWTVGSDLRIRNVATGQCLLAGAEGAVTTGACTTSSSSKWVWLTSPSP